MNTSQHFRRRLYLRHNPNDDYFINYDDPLLSICPLPSTVIKEQRGSIPSMAFESSSYNIRWTNNTTYVDRSSWHNCMWRAYTIVRSERKGGQMIVSSKCNNDFVSKFLFQPKNCLNVYEFRNSHSNFASYPRTIFFSSNMRHERTYSIFSSITLRICKIIAIPPVIS